MGCALQLQQAVLWDWPIYASLLAIVQVFIAYVAIKFVAHRSRQNASVQAISPANGSANRRTATRITQLTKSRTAVRYAAVLLLAAACGFGLTGLRAVVFKSTALNPSLEGVDVQVVGVVTAMPQRSDAGLRFRLNVESALRLAPKSTDDDALRTNLAAVLPASIYLSWYNQLLRSEDPAAVPFAQLQQGASDLQAGERWAMTVRLKAPHGTVNPHGFDYELWMWEQGLQASGYVRATERDVANGTAPRMIGSTWQHPIERARQHVRDAIFARVTEPRLAGVIAALVVGDQAAIERADWDVYRATGVAHLMSISGLHVTMFAWVAALCVGWLWRRSTRAMLWLPAQHAALIGGVLLATGYALFSGWGVPSQRTIWMLSTVALLRLSGKQWPWPLVWLLAMAVVVAIDPWALLQAGFWLSFVAVGVLFASDQRGASAATIADQALPAKRSLRQHPVVQKLLSAAREQWIITLALAPLSLLLFQQVSLIGLVANAIAIPWVTLVVTPLAMLGVLWAPVWDAAALCVNWLGQVLQWFSYIPWATLSVAAPPWALGAAAVLGGVLLAMQLPWPLRAMGVAAMLPAFLWQAPRPAQGQFEVLAADIGQGNAVLVRTARRALLYDTGPRFSRESDAGQRTLVPLLRALGEQLDTIIVSHRDSDHSGGALAVQAMQPNAALLSSLEGGHEIIAARDPKQSTQRCKAGQRWQWDGVDFQILHPQAADYEAQSKPNALSCVLRISNGQRTALLVADIEAPQEARLIADNAPLQADLLLAPHHGSKTSSTEAFLDTVKPSIAIFQAGYRNRFNHPAPEVAQRYSDRNIKIIASPQCGAATWRSDSPLRVTCQRQLQQRYWQHKLP